MRGGHTIQARWITSLTHVFSQVGSNWNVCINSAAQHRLGLYLLPRLRLWYVRSCAPLTRGTAAPPWLPAWWHIHNKLLLSTNFCV